MHRYYLLSRPPLIGTHPHGDIAREVWQPVQPIPNEHGGNGGRMAHGWVEYDHELPVEEVHRYELWPAVHAYTLVLLGPENRFPPRESELYRVTLPASSPNAALVRNRDRSVQFRAPCTPDLHRAIGALGVAYFVGSLDGNTLSLFVGEAAHPWPADW